MTPSLRAAAPAILLLMSACSQPAPQTAAAKPSPPALASPPASPSPSGPTPAAQPETAAATPAPQDPGAGAGGGAQALVARINDAVFTPASADSASAGGGEVARDGSSASDATPDPMLVKAQVLMARADASPGVIDGRRGSNFQHALLAYARMNGLDGGDHGKLTPAIWAKLTAGPPTPVAATYTITAQDAAGPYYPDVGEDLVKMAQLQHVGYSRPSEMLAERFHMAEGALKALNPGADFGKAGTTLVVAQVGDIDLPKVDHIEVDKAHAALRAYDRAGEMIAFMPATVGSVDRQSPSGVHKVVGVAHDPKYTYDPKKLTWGPRDQGKFVVPSGPNNPVGVVWIDLNAPSYGLHGSPGPDEIGKTASHGCVRMTNWDATQLAAAVKPGVIVKFINSRA